MSDRRKLKFASCFTGIGGFDLGMDKHIDSTVQVEINPHCQTVLNRHWPNILKREDITDVTGKEIGRIDGLHGGFPCTGTSFGAPNRQGLAHRESAHFFDFIRLLDEYQRLIDETNPRWVVIENPVGLLSSPRPPKKGTQAWKDWDGVDRTGWDMAAVVRALEDLGYGWAYRVVDGRYLGTPQKRERVIVVGHRGGDPRPAWEVLGDGGPGEEPPRPRTQSSRSGPRAHRGAGADGTLIWRKSARARATLAKGGYETWVEGEFANTLNNFDGGLATRQTHLMFQGGRLRTFTPLEWERLQGFPDGWTEGLPDSARYEALGNAMHVGMAQWLGQRLAAVHHALPQIESTHLQGGAA